MMMTFPDTFTQGEMHYMHQEHNLRNLEYHFETLSQKTGLKVLEMFVCNFDSRAGIILYGTYAYTKSIHDI